MMLVHSYAGSQSEWSRIGKEAPDLTYREGWLA